MRHNSGHGLTNIQNLNQSRTALFSWNCSAFCRSPVNLNSYILYSLSDYNICSESLYLRENRSKRLFARSVNLCMYKCRYNNFTLLNCLAINKMLQNNHTAYPYNCIDWIVHNNQELCMLIFIKSLPVPKINLT